MKYGLMIPDIQDVSPQMCARIAHEAEARGWDAIFFWDADWGPSPWVILSAMAVATERIRIGSLLHPLPWRQPWLFARDAATLDQLSNGRLIIPFGFGGIEEDENERGRTRVGQPVDRKVRAQLIDEGLEVINGLWSGKPVTFSGDHWQLEEFEIRPMPVQAPRIPIWAVGVPGKSKSMARVFRCDGMLVKPKITADEIQQIKQAVAEQRTLSSSFDLIMEDDTRNDIPEQARAKVRDWADAGGTWWVETMWNGRPPLEDVLNRIRKGWPTIA
jgi:alkanesulfonate monooxygenase SsuD/methylene tetrahydromethanopterin reductase-like flavin-dependent oxidoreductase (luciferase family)